MSNQSTALISSRKIFLLGFMGSGKSYWGRIWAQHAGLQFADLDALIEKEEGMSVAGLFEQKGEAYFRERERALLHAYAGKENFILSCGGGTPCFNNNIHWMNEHGHTVYLQATPEYIYEKIAGEKDKRPLLKNVPEAELLSFIGQKLQERSPFYEKATLKLPAATLGTASIHTILHPGL
jgi:shikimate kinase